MTRLKRIRKLLYAAVGFAVALAVLIPPEAPGKLNEAAAVVLALGALVGVYRAKNATDPAPTTYAQRGGDASPRHPDWPAPPADPPRPLE